MYPIFSCMDPYGQLGIRNRKAHEFWYAPNTDSDPQHYTLLTTYR